MKSKKQMKKQYNYLIQRFYNGCKYLEEHRKEIDKYIHVLLEIIDNLGEILKEMPEATKKEILNGFKV